MQGTDHREVENSIDFYEQLSGVEFLDENPRGRKVQDLYFSWRIKESSTLDQVSDDMLCVHLSDTENSISTGLNLCVKQLLLTPRSNNTRVLT